MRIPSPEDIKKAVQLLNQGKVIAYPTEAVFGLGCDPFNEQAMNELLKLKQRPIEKGVILIAADIKQVQGLVEIEGQPWQSKVQAGWPGPMTWVLPVKDAMPGWITGGRETLAVRVSSHPTVKALCEAYGGPIVSTSANLTGEEPAKSCQQIKAYFADQIFCLNADLGELAQPTQIWDARSKTRLR